MMLDGKVRDGRIQAAWAVYLIWKSGQRS